ncbi:Amino acid adenylation domain protein [Hyphomicrobium sp. GJ21]|uniref:non-ribosomal peptide synthetase n=1 Tax=Hyphomicrobium sp. GJ21 TaxID=113574 RepID=UPI000622BA28|nr:non-ribosomal peptide synthetase [Hyphomicrobium sp. GJ21]CEJ85457.1 Amino acid adenylation domain protein [Hyphomicrobium sp. GJ21]
MRERKEFHVVPVESVSANREPQSTLPVTPQQREVWVESQMGDDASCAYNQCFVLHLRGPLSLASMQSALDQVIARHAALRTSFDKSGDKQRILPSRAVTIIFEDLSAIDPAQQQAAFERIIDREATEAFNLATDPLLRAKVLRFSADVHRLVVTVHHIVCDGWSSSVLFSDLAKSYEADCFGLEPQLTDPMSYETYVQDLVDKSTDTADEEYWLAQLTGELPNLDLPNDHQRPALRSRSGARQDIRVDADLYKRIKTVGAGRGATLFHTLLAAFEVLMFRLSGQDDIVLGIPLAGQSELDNSHLVAHCVATMPLRCHVDPAATFGDFLKSVRGTFLAGQQHPDVTFSSLLPKLNIERDPSRPTLVSVVFNIDRIGAPFEFGDLTLDRLETPKRFVTFDLNVNVVDNGTELTVECEYNSDILEADTVRRWLEHFHTLLSALTRDPETSLAALDILGDDERRRIFDVGTGADVPLPSTQVVHRLFEQQVDLTPDAEAIIADDVRLTYRDLDQRANKLAHYLQSQGAKPGEIIGVCLPRNADLIATLLAVMKTGACYVPLDPAYPADRIGVMLSEAKANILITVSSLDRLFPAYDKVRVLIDTDAAAIAAQNDARLNVDVQANDLAYVLYTSGSTGKPKGVAVEHRNAAALIAWARSIYDQRQITGVLAATSVCFDLSIFEIFFPLASGGRIILAENALALAQLPARNEVTLLNTVPSAGAELVRIGGIPASVETVNLAGEPLPTSLVDSLYATGTVKRVYDLYGPTEDTTYSTYTLRQPGEPATIGRPIANGRAYILDRFANPVPLGIPGEIYVGGAGVARGYLHQPQMTAERFTVDPFRHDAGARLYRTGDLARFRADGNIEYLGRIDNQVKVRGFRIELGEIEAALKACAGVTDTVVVAREDVPGDKRLVGYVVASGTDATLVDRLFASLSARLPAYMVPAHIIVLNELPLNANGKLDRKALPAPEATTTISENAITSAATETEATVAAIWQKVLRREAIDCTADFFRLGGHSLLATQVASRIRDAFAIELPVAQLFQHRTVQALASRIDDVVREQKGLQPLPAITPRNSNKPAPMSVAQERMWLTHELAPESKAYNIPVALELSGPLDIEAIEQAIDAMRTRHETLRTTYHLDGSRPLQVVHPWSKQPLEIIDLSHLGRDALKEALRQATDHAGRYFDLARDVMLRSVLFRLGNESHLLLLTAHHIAIDNWSLGLLSGELATAYNNIRAGRPAGLKPQTTTYSDYAQWQRNWLDTNAEPQLAYWRKKLDGIEPIELPTDKPRPDIFGYQGKIYEQPFSENLRDQLEQLGRREGYTLFMTLLAAYAVLLHRVTGQSDFTIAVPIANRTHTATETLVGTFINTLVLRIDLEGRPTLREVLRRIEAVALDAYAHQDAPFEQLAKELPGARDNSRPPLAQVMFNLLNAPATRRIQLDGLDCKDHAIDLEAAQFEIGLTIDSILSNSLKAEYDSELFDESTIARFVGQYQRVLDSLLTDLDVCIDDIPLLAAEETDKIRSWNLTSASYPSETPFTRLFEDQVQKNPDAIAVSFSGEDLTYNELNARANQLANVLLQHGAKSGMVVGVCLDRSLELLVSLLAIQKSGAAYLPLDPGFPAERLTYMVQDSGAAVLLTAGEAAAALDKLDGVSILDLDHLSLDGVSRDNLAVAPAPDDPAYLIYTSGSTGRPKGVVVHHRALVNLLSAMRLKPGLSDSDVFAAITTISFDIAALELYLPLLVGARIELVPRETAVDGAKLLELLAASKVTTLQATPATWRMLIDEEWQGNDRLRAFSGGEALTADLAKVLLPRVKELWNLYGPTETTIWSSVEKIEPGDDLLSIGRPISNTQMYIVDRAGQAVSAGVPGEIWIGGDGVALGYRNRPEMTAERFVRDHFTDHPGARLYRTGDLGRWLPDGRLQHLGRIDNQVKVRGFRIELGEIEAALKSCPGVADAVVVAREDVPGDKKLVAYFVGVKGDDLTASEIRRYLRSVLPDYMIPSFFITLQALPLTANGKVDRRALPNTFRSARSDTVVSEPPSTEMEKLLASIWRDELRIEKINAGENFFNLGGHSLLAIKVAVALQKKIGWRMDPRSLFFQSLRQIAAQAEAAVARSQQRDGST